MEPNPSGALLRVDHGRGSTSHLGAEYMPGHVPMPYVHALMTFRLSRPGGGAVRLRCALGYPGTVSDPYGIRYGNLIIRNHNQKTPGSRYGTRQSQLYCVTHCAAARRADPCRALVPHSALVVSAAAIGQPWWTWCRTPWICARLASIACAATAAAAAPRAGGGTPTAGSSANQPRSIIPKMTSHNSGGSPACPRCASSYVIRTATRSEAGNDQCRARCHRRLGWLMSGVAATSRSRGRRFNERMVVNSQSDINTPAAAMSLHACAWIGLYCSRSSAAVNGVRPLRFAAARHLTRESWGSSMRRRSALGRSTATCNAGATPGWVSGVPARDDLVSSTYVHGDLHVRVALHRIGAVHEQ